MVRINSFFIALIMVVGLSSCNLQQGESCFKTGDLLFTSSEITADSSRLSDAINEVTQTVLETNYTHMGLVVVENGVVEVIHAAPKKGVCREPLEKFFTKTASADLFRLKADYQPLISKAVERSAALLGLPYDSLYIMTGEGYYCSSLVYALFEEDEVFKLEPMSFKDPSTGDFHPSWKVHYERLNVDIPEGLPGCNPNGMANSGVLELVGAVNIEKLELFK